MQKPETEHMAVHKLPGSPCVWQWNQKYVGSMGFQSLMQTPQSKATVQCETGLKAERINSLCLGEKGHFQREDGSLRIRRRDSPSWPRGAVAGQWGEATEKPRDGTSPTAWTSECPVIVLCLIQDVKSGLCLMLGDEAAVAIRRRLWLSV